MFESEGDEIYQQWWFYVAIGGAVLCTCCFLALGILLSRKKSSNNDENNSNTTEQNTSSHDNSSISPDHPVYASPRSTTTENLYTAPSGSQTTTYDPVPVDALDADTQYTIPAASQHTTYDPPPSHDNSCNVFTLNHTNIINYYLFIFLDTTLRPLDSEPVMYSAPPVTQDSNDNPEMVSARVSFSNGTNNNNTFFLFLMSIIFY